MEHELTFTLHLAMYQEADLGDYITFMMNFRGVLIHLKPSEVIELETIYTVNIIDLMMEILPYHDPHDVPWFENFLFRICRPGQRIHGARGCQRERRLCPNPMDSICHPQTVRFGVQGLETLWCSKLDHLDSIGASSVGRVCKKNAKHEWDMD
ncbi:hypothetical protein TNCV_3860811 [Trichonephila clavipes]|nr:hypothetical protein TNCV_3860811 [Trichonephila clavipes]